MKQESAASDVLSFDEKTETKQPEDKAIEPISEIPSLLQHYSKDMELALRITQDKITGQAKVKQQLDNLQQRLLTLEAELTGEYQHYEHLTFIIMAVCSLLIISAVLICISVERVFCAESRVWNQSCQKLRIPTIYLYEPKLCTMMKS